MILVMASPRSGTRYIKRILQGCNLSISHESKKGIDGVSTWRIDFRNMDVVFANHIDHPRRQSIKDYDFVLHQVRHPLNVINSLCTIGAWSFICQTLSYSKRQSKLLLAMNCWYIYNLQAEKVADVTYRVEDIDNQFEEICYLVKIVYNKDVLVQIPRDDHTRKHKSKYGKFTWEDVKNENNELYNNIINLAQKYGYSI